MAHSLIEAVFPKAVSGFGPDLSLQRPTFTGIGTSMIRTAWKSAGHQYEREAPKINDLAGKCDVLWAGTLVHIRFDGVPLH